MIERITEATLAEFEAFNQSHPKGNFAQSSYWAKQKPMWKWEAVACRGADGKIKGTVSMLIRRALKPLPYTIVYACRGPVCDLDDYDTIRELVEGAKQIARENHAYVFRLELRGRTEEELLASFHQKTRYNIRLAMRKGVEVRVCGKEMIPAFSELMLVTGVRDGFVTRQPEYFSAMLDNLGEHCRLYMAFYEGEPIAGTLAIWYGDKVWYLYGASSNEHRNLMPNYLLQWEMIRWAVEKNCRIYDFRGVPGLVPEDHPLYGLVKFKRGFNGDYTEFVGEMDLILKPFINRSAKLGFDVLREVRMKLYLLRHRDKKTDHVKGTPSHPEGSGGTA